MKQPDRWLEEERYGCLPDFQENISLLENGLVHI